MPSSPARKQKIAILGGGTGALAAAFGLVEDPDWRDKYEITVYQLGWRLGGKGASGRNAQRQNRIEEHGLHVWAGFYENAFLLMRKCYERLQRPPNHPLATVWDAFKRHSNISLTDKTANGWQLYNVDIPTDDDLPGEGGELPSVWGYVELVVKWMYELFASEPLAPSGAQAPTAARPIWLGRLAARAHADIAFLGGR
ncbi:MAG: NAD(P)-binding protein, partial [Gemmataceae bacterium]|nr:NAD(P)-binding protein [Gemmataceae bacterium]